ncbi:MAG: inositol-3-phosphate synthase, partial [Candidatus Anammoxibacter sp.]
MGKINIAIIGVGNCVSSLIQGIYYYRNKSPKDMVGLMNWEISGYEPGDIEVVAAFDIDKRKVGKDVNEAIFEKPNCTTVFHNGFAKQGVNVQMGKVLDGFSDHMKDYDDGRTFILSDESEPSKED